MHSLGCTVVFSATVVHMTALAAGSLASWGLRFASFRLGIQGKGQQGFEACMGHKLTQLVLACVEYVRCFADLEPAWPCE